MNVGVLCGGFGDERAISLKTAQSIYSALKDNGYGVICLDPAVIDKKIKNEDIFSLGADIKVPKNIAAPYIECLQYFNKENIDIVFIALHGGEGEDGRIQSLIDMFGIPYTGSGPEASAIGMDKDLSKTLVRAIGQTTPDWYLIQNNDYDENEIMKLGLPLVIKGNHQGSSVSLTIIDNWQDLKAAVGKGMVHDTSVIAEKYIAGRELTVSMLEGEALPVIEIVPQKGVYDYQAKYTSGGSQYFAPADLDHALTQKVKNQALAIWNALKLENYARIDFRLDESGIPFFLEANTLPGMTSLSLIPMAAKANKINFITLLGKIIEGALRRFKVENKHL